MRVYFALISTVLLVLSGYAAYRDYTPEWKDYQRQYYRLLADFEEDAIYADQIAGTPLQVKQVYNESYRIVDRCITCHISYADPRFKDQPPPLTTHPAKILEKHAVEDIGCAVCHDGNGYGTSVKAAHGLEEHSARPLLTGKWKESLCVRCHLDGRSVGAAAIGRGLELIDRAACFACHNIEELAGRARIAPNLDGIGNKVHPQWLKQWLMNPKGYLDDTLMPDYGLDEEQALAITAYLMTLTRPELATAESTAANAADAGRRDLERGQELFESSGCRDCHSVSDSAGFEGIVAPDLTRIGDKVNAEWLAAWVKNPAHFQPGVAMPGFGFTAEEADLLAGYLIHTFVTTREDSGQLSDDPALSAALGKKQSIERGAALIDELGCLSCHALGGKKLEIKIGPDLSDAGDWDPHHLEWGNVEPQRQGGLREYLGIKVESPRIFADDNKMPTFGFSAEDVEAVVVALTSFSANPLPLEARVGSSSATLNLPMPAGSVKKAFDRYQCLVCHSLRGRFGQMAPDLSFEGDKVKKQWLVEYLRTPHLIRPLMEERMPDFGISAEEVQLVADFIDVAWKDDRVPEDPFHGSAPSQELVARGKMLYESEYSCADCHTRGEEIGPELERVGQRLKPGWIYQFVLDPHLFYDNEMQNEEVPEDDARALTAYLMSRRE